MYQSHSFGSGTSSIPALSGATWTSPATWSGYTSSDTNVAGSNRFATATKFAPFASSSPGDVVADNLSTVTGAAVNDTFTLTFKVATAATQLSGRYQTTLVLSAVATP